MAEVPPNSYYAATANTVAPFEQLLGEVEADVAILGGGFTGVSTALELAERGIRVAVLEANSIGWGASGRNGGQIRGSLSGDRAMLRQFRSRLGGDVGDFVWGLRFRGHDIIRRRVDKYGIACDLKSGHMQAAYQPSHVAELEAMYRLAVEHGMGDEVEMVYGADIQRFVGSTIYHAGLVNRRNMHVHPLNLCLGEADAARSLGARIFEDAPVISITRGSRSELCTASGRVRAQKVLIAGNAGHSLGGARLAGMLLPASLGVVATEPLSTEVARMVNPHDLAVYDTRFVLDYYRLTADKRLLFGSGTNYSGRETRNLKDALRPAIERTFPQLAGIGIDFGWQGQDGISINRIPQLGRLSSNIYYAQGYSGHGIATSHVVGEIMADAISEKPSDFDLFSKVSHIRLPFGQLIGGTALAAGMLFFRIMEKLK